MIAHRGEVNVVVTSAKELDAKMLLKVKDVLAKNELGGSGKKLLISNKVRNRGNLCLFMSIYRLILKSWEGLSLRLVTIQLTFPSLQRLPN